MTTSQRFRFTNSSLFELQNNGTYKHVCKVPPAISNKSQAIDYYYNLLENEEEAY